MRGAGRYTADENLPGQVYAVMLRSPHAHARIRAIATDDAKAMPGVLAVLTGADFLADGLKPIPHKPWSPHPAETQLHNKDGTPPFEAPHFPLPADKARFVGEAVAMVVAETVHAAKDGAERIAIDYDVAARGRRNRRRRAPGCAACARRGAARMSASMPSLATRRRPPPLLRARRM